MWFFSIFKQEKNSCLQCHRKNSRWGTGVTCPQFTTTHTLLYQQSVLTLVLTISFPVLMKSALLLVGNVMEKMTVGIILMKMDVVSKYYFKIVSDPFDPGWSPVIIRVEEELAYALLHHWSNLIMTSCTTDVNSFS